MIMFISIPSPGISGVTSEGNPRTASRLLSLNWRLMKSCFVLVNICFLKKSPFISGFMTELMGRIINENMGYVAVASIC